MCSMTLMSLSNDASAWFYMGVTQIADALGHIRSELNED